MHALARLLLEREVYRWNIANLRPALRDRVLGELWLVRHGQETAPRVTQKPSHSRSSCSTT